MEGIGYRGMTKIKSQGWFPHKLLFLTVLKWYSFKVLWILDTLYASEDIWGFGGIYWYLHKKVRTNGPR